MAKVLQTLGIATIAASVGFAQEAHALTDQVIASTGASALDIAASPGVLFSLALMGLIFLGRGRKQRQNGVD